jgi:MoaA/NifB/PqqE/SkfB family radical SAM enzyme
MTAVPINESVPVIRGLNLSNIRLQDAEQSNKMLLIDIETSNLCNLNCQYCFRDIYGTKEALKREMPLGKRLDLIRQAKKLGCETIKITGAGEPFADKDVWPMIEYANNLGMWVLIFTNGSLIDEPTARRLYSMDVSLIVKCNSFDEEKEDRMVGRKGYARRRNQSLRYLINTGFNSSMPTRLGRDLVITKINESEIYDALRWCRKNNVFPLFRPLMPIGAARKLKDWMLSKEETKSMYEKARKIDEKEFKINYNLTLPYMGGVWCRQLHYALYVNILGEAYACTGSKKLLGNFNQQKLLDIWNSEEARRIRDTPYESCPLRESYWRGDKDYDCI